MERAVRGAGKISPVYRALFVTQKGKNILPCWFIVIGKVEMITGSARKQHRRFFFAKIEYEKKQEDLFKNLMLS